MFHKLSGMSRYGKFIAGHVEIPLKFRELIGDIRGPDIGDLAPNIKYMKNKILK